MSGIEIVLWVYGGFIANLVLGVCVLAGIDDPNESLFHWATDKQAPWPVYPLVLTLWPVVTYYFLRTKPRDTQAPSADAKGK